MPVFLSVGENVKLLVDRPDGNYCFRLHKDRVFYVRYRSIWHQKYGTRNLD